MIGSILNTTRSEKQLIFEQVDSDFQKSRSTKIKKERKLE